MRKCWIALLTVLCLACGLVSRAAESDSVRVSLLTCMPGSEIYALDGHSALRVVTAEGDSVWNYGLFSFEQPNFVYRFVKGETDYMVGAYPTAWFLPEYRMRGSRVYEQVLNLTPEEANGLLAVLRDDIKLENREYRYNYIRDNCATRIRDHVEHSVGGVVYNDSLHFGTYRKQMTADHANYPWYQFGIDLALGSGLDKDITARDEMFTPLEMRRRFDTARRADGQPLVSETVVLVDGSDAAIEPPTPWYLTPLFICWLTLAVVLVAVWSFRKRRTVLRWIYGVYYGIEGLAGYLIAFLVFISVHEATSPNMLILWLNPLQLLVPLTIGFRRTRPIFKFMMWYNIVVVGILLILWPTGPQSMNPAFLPLMLLDILLAVLSLRTQKALRVL